ncbi:putative transcription factor interactor and regulator CCHC(Zn) family [Helianthus annuus]|nr:putative transcription factor interactor and regulator CCHC(Zn) family [Helianthus annuus]
MKKDVQKKETRACYQCYEIGHIARYCSKATNSKHGVSLKLKEKVVEKTEPPTEKFKIFENSTYEIGECSKRFYKRKTKLDNRKWVIKKIDVKSSDDSNSSKSEDLSSGDESDSTKSEEQQIDPKCEKSVPPMDDANFPPLRADNFKQKDGKVDISNQFYSVKKELDVEKAFNGKVKHIFGKTVDGGAKGVKELYASKKKVHKPVESDSEDEKITPKVGQAWVSIFFDE